MQLNSDKYTVSTVVALLVVLPLVFAHGYDEMPQAGTVGAPSEMRPTITTVNSTTSEPESYFQYGEHSALIFCHILLMSLGWVFVLPVGLMLSIAQSRYRFTVQFLFLVLNAVGILLVTIYNASTPDLYPNNTHHKIGWVLTCVITAQVVMGVIGTYAKYHSTGYNLNQAGCLPVSTEAMAEHHRFHNLSFSERYRFSNDSGQGTERNTESLRSQSFSSSSEDEDPTCQPMVQHEDEETAERHGLLQNSRLNRFLANWVPGLLFPRTLKVLDLVCNTIDRLVLVLGFVAITTGIVTYGGLFKGQRIFSGLAHFIKGGVFFWYGILTLGRWAGCFANIGWAWNISPAKSKRPSAEFVESFLIFFYGSSNVFLEHLASWGAEWAAEDFEHISITIMFIGGGMCGMLIESNKVRNLLNMTARISSAQSNAGHLHHHSEKLETLEPPKSYSFSMNPIPALIVLLLGTMMSSHHQETMFATMIHKQWGNLLVGAAFARAATYVIFYLAPPTSILPGRPPSELITSFCLMAGGFVFMASARDCVMSMEAYGLDSMFVFTVTMGIITFLMAWVILVIAVKGWAMSKESSWHENTHEAMA